MILNPISYFLRHQLIVLCQQSIHHPRIQWEHCTLDGWMVATAAFEITHGICLLTHQKRWKALGWEGAASCFSHRRTGGHADGLTDSESEWEWVGSRHALHTTGFEGESEVARTHPVIGGRQEARFAQPRAHLLASQCPLSTTEMLQLENRLIVRRPKYSEKMPQFYSHKFL